MNGLIFYFLFQIQQQPPTVQCPVQVTMGICPVFQNCPAPMNTSHGFAMLGLLSAKEDAERPGCSAMVHCHLGHSNPLGSIKIYTKNP